jgi:ABC-type antimicrobial peptide transport system permease subunit
MPTLRTAARLRLSAIICGNNGSRLTAGLVLGLPIALGAARLIRTQLYRMSPFDPTIFIAAAAGITAVTVLSAWLPTRRAAAVDPAVSLRCE